jgi:nitroreductase
MELDKAIKSRRTVKKFKSKKPDWREIIECIDTMRYAPMAGNIFSLKFILVSDEKKIQELSVAAQQDFITQTKYIVVVCTNPKRTITAYKERGEKYIRQQAGAAIQNFLLKITDIGLATSWIGHFDDSKVKEILKIPEDIEVEALFPIGFEYKKPLTKKAKIDLAKTLSFEDFNNKRMKVEKKLNA